MKIYSGFLRTIFLGTVSSLIVGSVSLAAVPAKPLRVVKGSGSFYGGQAGPGFSLIGFKRTQIKNGERIFLSVGDMREKPMKGLPGYYHVEMRGNKIVVDFAQMPLSKVKLNEIQAAVRKSKNISAVAMALDSADGGLNLIFTLRNPVSLNVLQVPGQKFSSQVVLQILE
ncbi:MAG: hypothetical protein V4736_14125 [Bdellovibrionota bacterium]